MLTCFVQRFSLQLSFQLDDYNLLADPAQLFTALHNAPGGPQTSHMMRFPVWIAWTLVHGWLPAPLPAWPFHLLGLLLHAGTAALLTGLILRHAPPEIARIAAVIAGLGYGCGAGSAAALGWISGHPDLFVNLFGLGGLALLGSARDSDRRGSLALGLALIALALFSKGPALLVPALVGLALIANPRRQRLNLEVAGLASITLLSLLARRLYLGTFLPTYPGESSPDPTWLAGGLLRLGQALVPWNRSAEAAELSPWLLAAHLDSAPGRFSALVAAAIFLPLLIGLWLVPKRRALPILCALAALLIAVLPGGPIDGGPHRLANPTTNSTARAMMLALLVVWPLTGLGLAAIASRKPLLGLLGALALAVPTAGLHAHVVRIERKADRVRVLERHRVLEGLADLEASVTDAPLDEPWLILLEVPPDSFAGIAQNGGLFSKSFLPPFLDRSDLLLEQDTSVAALVTRSWNPNHRQRNALLAPLDPGARLLLPRFDPAMALHDSDPEIPVVAIEDLAPRALAGFAIAPAQAGSLRLLHGQPSGQESEIQIRFGKPDPERTAAVGLPRTREFLESPWTRTRLGGPMGPSLASFTPLTELPKIELQPVPREGAASELVFAADREPAALVSWPSDFAPPDWLRFELTVQLFHRPLRAYCDVPAPGEWASSPAPTQVQLSHWHLRPELSPGETAPHGTPWAAIAPQLLTHGGLDRRHTRLVVHGLPEAGPPGAYSDPLHVELAP